VDLDESVFSIMGRAIKAKVSALFAVQGTAIPFLPDPDGRLEDGKRWWEVRPAGAGTVCYLRLFFPTGN
jgi:hypothetical protein